MSGSPEPDAANWDKLCCQAQKIIVKAKDDEDILHIINCNTCAGMWTKLESVYAQKSVHFLQQSCFSYQKDSVDNISIHVSESNI